LGHEIIGTVAALGTNVTTLKIGDRVGYGFQKDCCGKCEWCKSANENCCTEGDFNSKLTPFLTWGGYATAIQHPAKFAIPIPPEFPDNLAPSMMCAGVTVYMPIKRYLKSGDKVAVIGCGGLGHLAVQFAAKIGCKVTVFTTHKEEKSGLLKQYGAENFVGTYNLKEVEEQKSQFDAIICTPRPDKGFWFSKYLDCLKPFGKFIYTSNSTNVEIEDPQPLMMKHAQIIGTAIGPIDGLKETLEFGLKHKVFPQVEMWQFEEMDKAYKKLKDGIPLFRGCADVKTFAEKHGLHKVIQPVLPPTV